MIRGGINRKTVVVTGMGVISPIGNNLGEFRASLKEGRSGEGPITRFSPEQFRFKKACEVKDLSPAGKLPFSIPSSNILFMRPKKLSRTLGLRLRTSIRTGSALSWAQARVE